MCAMIVMTPKAGLVGRKIFLYLGKMIKVLDITLVIVMSSDGYKAADLRVILHDRQGPKAARYRQLLKQCKEANQNGNASTRIDGELDPVITKWFIEDGYKVEPHHEDSGSCPCDYGCGNCDNYGV